MGFKSLLVKPFAKKIARDIDRWSKAAVNAQEKIFLQLIQKGKRTAFGKDHQFDRIRSYEQFVEQVPVRDYEGISSYIERIKKVKRTYCGPVAPYILLKHRVQLLVLNTFH